MDKLENGRPDGIGAGAPAYLSPEFLEIAAQELFSALERFDPSSEGPWTWADLLPAQKEIYRASMQLVFVELQKKLKFQITPTTT